MVISRLSEEETKKIRKKRDIGLKKIWVQCIVRVADAFCGPCVGVTITGALPHTRGGDPKNANA